MWYHGTRILSGSDSRGRYSAARHRTRQDQVVAELCGKTPPSRILLYGEDLVAARCEAAQLVGSPESQTHGEVVQAACFEAAALQQKRTWVVQHMESVFKARPARKQRGPFVGRDCQKVLQQRNERLLQSLAFHGMIMARSCSQAGVLLA